MRGGQHRVRREYDWWFGPSVEVLSLVTTKVFALFSAGCTGLLELPFGFKFAGYWTGSAASSS